MTNEIGVGIVLLVAVALFPPSIAKRLFPGSIRVTYDELNGWRVHYAREGDDQ